MNEQQHPFPMEQPEVTTTPRPEADLKEVRRLDAGGFFVLLQVGAEVKWSFYDWPERRLTGVSRTRASGTVEYHGQQCLEIVDHMIAGNDAGWIGRWLYVVSADEMQTVLFESRDATGRQKIEEVDASPQPLRLRVGNTWTAHEVFRCGPEERGADEVHHGAVDGPFGIALPAGQLLCLRETWWTYKPDGAGHTLAQLYVGESGRSYYFRRFNGPAYHNYDQLVGNPACEHDGVTWRLWYECLPDIALAASAEGAAE